MKKLWPAVLGAVLAAGLAGCTLSPDKVTPQLEAMGFTDVKVGGPDLFACGKDDGFSATFTAVGQNGKQVRGVACAGTFKGVTIRFE